MSRNSVLDSWLSHGLGALLGMAVAFNAWAGDTAITVGDASVTVTGPNSTTIDFPVTRTGDLSYDAYLNYQTLDGTALANKDYRPVAGSLKLPAGVSSMNLPISVNGSSTDSADKSFSVNIPNATNIEPTASFASYQSFASTQNDIYSVVMVDVNGDGKPDMVTANLGSNTMSVRLNTGTIAGSASFGAEQVFAAGVQPIYVASLDINSDGLPDLAVANILDNTVSVYLNTTTPGSNVPGFTLQQVFNTGNGPRSIAVADMNNDGLPDLVVADASAFTVSVLLNTTSAGSMTASFYPHQDYATGGSGTSESVAIADVNGDGKPDLLVAHHLYDAAVLLNNRNSTIASPNRVTGVIHYAVMPIAVGGVITTNVNSPATGVLVAHAAVGSNLTYSVVSTPAHGTLSITDVSTGAFTYTPVTGYQGPDSFTFKVQDNLGNLSNVATEAEVVSNTAFAANAGSLGTQADQSVSGNLTTTLAYTGETPTYVVVTNPAHGSVFAVNATSGRFTYTPATGYVGTDSFRFVATGPNGEQSSSATETITVADVAPVSNDGTVLAPGGTVTGTLSAAPSYAGQAYTFGVVSNPVHGAVVIDDSGTGAFTYTASSGYNGPDSFTFQVEDVYGTVSNVATESVTVSGAAATANDGNVSTSAGMGVNGTLSATPGYSGQTLTFAVGAGPSHGSVGITNAATGAFSYTPASGYVGSDSFTFIATDTNGAVSNTATESVTVTDVAVTANDGSLTAAADATTGGMLSATSAYTGQTMTFAVVSNPSHGSVSITNAATGAFTYTTSGDYTGSDSFTFNVTDGYGTISNTATQTVTVNGAVASLTPGSWNFGNVVLGTLPNHTKDFTLKNNGNVTLNITSIAKSGTAFTESDSCGATLAAGGGQCTITISFAPGTPGAKTGSLTVNSDAVNTISPVSLAGTSTQADADFIYSGSPNPINFGTITVNDYSSSKTVTLKNVGTASLTNISVSTSGGQFGAFIETPSSCSNLAPGDQCVISVVFHPATTGSKTTNLHFAYKIDLTGTGYGHNIELDGTAADVGGGGGGSSCPPPPFQCQ